MSKSYLISEGKADKRDASCINLDKFISSIRLLSIKIFLGA